MSVASKNLFAALGSDDESDSRPVAQSTTSKTETKTTRHDNAAPRGGRGGDRGERGGRGGRGARGGRGRGGASRGGYSNEDALKDSADVRANRERDASESRPRGGSRGGRGTGGGRGREHDRHSATGRVDSQKAVDQGWGNETTSWESAAPIAESDREAEKKEAGEATAVADVAETSAPEAEREPEEEEPTQTYADYLANRMKSDFSISEVRKPDQSKWEATTSLLSKKARQVEEALFGEKTSEDKTSKSTSTKKSAPKKVVLDIEQRFTPAPRGGRGEGRGGRGGRGGSGESRGAGRGRGDGTSRGRGRGEERPTRGRGGAGGSARGGRGGAQTIDVADTNAFPALG